MACLFVLLSGPVGAYEPDVHFGLTQWLARSAGFDPGQATAIATGNFRVDSGLIATMELTLEHACVGLFPEAAADVQRRHYPSSTTVPARPEDRTVVAGGPAARKALADLMPSLEGKESLMLSKFGEALHPLQDSWSNAGVPGVPHPGAGVECDPTYASAPPANRRAAHPHGAALTYTAPGDVVAMAEATYQAMLAYPLVAKVPRQPKAWAELAPHADRFARARTKTQKREWFVSQGIDDTGFLRDTTLPDGLRPGPFAFAGRMLPPLNTAKSGQHDAAGDIKSFFEEVFVRWLGPDPVEHLVKALASPADVASSAVQRPERRGNAAEDRRLRELTARLKLWKLRDHGVAAVLAHAPAPLSAAQLREVDRLTRTPESLVQLNDLQAALFPVLPKSKYAPPLVPYVIRELPASDGQPRSIAMARLAHAPYDTIGLVAQRAGQGWVLIDIVFVVDQ